MNRIVVSAPFGNYLQFPDTTPTIGTFTVHKRAGWAKRLWKIISTLRYDSTSKSWSNQLGLPNPGIGSVGGVGESILSVHGFNEAEWRDLFWAALKLRAKYVELNLSCPNVGKIYLKDILGALEDYNLTWIAKLPPLGYGDMADGLYDRGVRIFHLCNTLPGGISGKKLKGYSLRAVENCRRSFCDLEIIGGGGITGWKDIQEYKQAGANYFSVASMLLNPFNWYKIRGFVDRLNLPDAPESSRTRLS